MADGAISVPVTDQSRELNQHQLPQGYLRLSDAMERMNITICRPWAMRRRLLPRTTKALRLLPLPRRRRKTGARDDLGPQNRSQPA